MRIVTWNCCRGDFEVKAGLLNALNADVVVFQECAKPLTESQDTLWFGDNPKNGLAVRARPPYHLKALPAQADAPKYVIPVAVTGPVNFTLLAVWSVGKQEYPYVRAISKSIDLYEEAITGVPAVVMGDFNSNAIWDTEHPADLNHSALVSKLASFDMVSAYHHVRKESHGSEREHSYYHHWKQDKPFHIDYCFLPRSWAERVTTVEIGGFEEWSKYSDHRPLLVDMNRPGF